MRVQPGAAVAREVLGARGHPGRLQAGDGGGGVPGDESGVRAEGSGADDRVVGGGVDVHRRSEIDIDAELAQVGPEGRVDGLGQPHVVDRAEGRAARVVAAGLVRDPGDVTALLIDGDDGLGDRCAQLAGQLGELDPVGHVRPEQGDAGQAFRQRRADPLGRLRAGKRRYEDCVGSPAQGWVGCKLLGHPFTAPATSPPTSLRRTIRKKITTGIVYIVDAAMIGPHCAPPRPKKYWT